ncbi:uncharacterized protein CC84DRAFT_1227943 [Paraphaeosphaeria sporulosa]|uniref:Beta-galactosidase n=1 Tax=Paraphaeosphaeria sporulosa TaxID=1460663 RepID=A0A177D0L3_9PLEO|nr:uncharacterized protein CC84DRAFT_1227943 [Paraphaeosphaeria sporulosa]OAG13056.1 hypothetical protein CC84DRAFT_1227943 [Paraphaeosphaeria sporulosa]
MKHFLNGVSAAALACLTIAANARAVGYRSPTDFIVPYKRQALQDIVTWDKDTIFINGERLFLYSGEVHPYRLPVPDLYIDIFQKIKALGYNGVSFYVDWALLEGKPGEYREEGVFDLKPFFDAASEAGIYLIARPGPYINAEVSGGGYPGWIQRVKGILRTRAEDYLNATDNYMANVGKTLAAAQITNGGPIILVQPENEYTNSKEKPFPDGYYMQYVEDQIRNAGVVVPLISNDANNGGHNVPGSGEGAVDIYGHDGYPLGFDCSNPEVWGDQQLVTDWYSVHLQQSPNTPYSIMEFQGGSYDPWGGPGFDKCLQLVNAAFERVFYKNIYTFGVTIFNIYMTFGGTNWGNLGHPGGYTSYDYAAPIAEDRQVNREKYSEQKLQANFFKVSPAYLTASRGARSTTQWTNNPAITVTDATNNSTKFYFVRHTTYNTLDSATYKLTIPTSAFGNTTIPQYNGTSLTLNGRDSKIHVSDYDMGGTTLVYSTAEIFTWHKYDDRTVLVVYGGPGETHELVIGATGLDVLEGDIKSTSTKGYTLLNFQADGTRKVAKVGVDKNFIYVYMLDRNSAYNYWSIDQDPHSNADAIILKAGYLVRTASVDGSTLALTGDLNATTSLEILGGAPSPLSKLTFNGAELDFDTTDEGVVTTTLGFTAPSLSLPDLSKLSWKYIDSLPEIQSAYDDSAWKAADLKETYNSHRALNTPTSLYGSDYGFHTGTLVYRGHFTASGAETSFFIITQGGAAYAASVWLDATFLGSYRGAKGVDFASSNFSIPSTLAGNTTHVLTVLVDNQGLDENWTVGDETTKNPRGIMDFALSGRAKSDVAWKITGNLGGEAYVDKSRGPLNEGGLFAERHGLHLPGALSASAAAWTNSKGPVADGLSRPGVGFFGAEFDLDIPGGWDVPLSFTFTNTTGNAHRVLLYVNGWQYGKYVSNIGPQTKFPVPQGILNHAGTNYLGVAVWALEGGETKLGGLSLGADAVIATGLGKVGNVDGDTYEARKGAY